MTKKKDENLTKREALILAWRKRKDFKGYDKSKGSSYNSWRAIIYNYKGREIGSPLSWKDYEIFMSEVQGDWSIGKIVTRYDTKLPHSKNNSFWGDKGCENISRMTKLEYDGYTKTLVEWCDEYNINLQGVRQRYFKGKDFSPHEILFGKQRKYRDIKERSAEFRSLRMVGAYKLRDKKRGFNNDITIDIFRDLVKNGCIYCGDMNNIGLDRVDNTKGHEQSNVVPCCHDCNCARMDNFSVEEMKLIGAVIRGIKRSRHENK